VEACLGDLLQYVIVERPEQAAAGFDIIREQQAGRCGFLIAGAGSEVDASSGDPNGNAHAALDGLIALESVVRVNGPYADKIRRAVGEAWIADSYDRAADATSLTALPIATMTGDMFRGPHLVTGGTPQETRGILETKREIKDLAARITEERERLFKLAEETAGLEGVIAQASSAIAAL